MFPQEKTQMSFHLRGVHVDHQQRRAERVSSRLLEQSQQKGSPGQAVKATGPPEERSQCSSEELRGRVHITKHVKAWHSDLNAGWELWAPPSAAAPSREV